MRAIALLLTLASVGLADPARALALFEVYFVEHNGSPIAATTSIAAAPSDTLKAELWLTTDSAGVDAYSISLGFDQDLGNELDVLSVLDLTPPPYTPIVEPPPTVTDSTGAIAGLVSSFDNAASAGLGPIDTTLVIGEIEFLVTANVASDGVDLITAFLDLGDGCFDNTGLACATSFAGASVNAIPEPSTGSLLALGLAGLAWGRAARSSRTTP